MSEYWDIVKDDKDSFNFGSIDQGLKDALTHKHVIWTDEVKANGYFKRHPGDIRQVNSLEGFSFTPTLF